MKLLIITQKVDSGDPVLGFFHAWLREFAGRAEAVTVIAQFTGAYALPANVTVLSLGKQNGNSSLKQVLKFWWLIVRHRATYDSVFVHMTPVWVLLGAPLWKLLGKRMYLWYEIKRGSWKLSVALRLVRKVFAATPQGIPGTSSKLVVTGHGIDTAVFAPDGTVPDENLLVTVGRVTGVKRLDILLAALRSLPPTMRLRIAGGTVTSQDAACLASLETYRDAHGLRDRVRMGWVPPDEVPALLRSAHVFLHAAEGGLDKALLQAMACGCIVLSCSDAAQPELPEECRSSKERFSEQLTKLLALSGAERQRLSEALRKRVVEHHALPRCIERLTQEMYV